MKYKHVFSICAYGDSPYLEACIRSLKEQTVPSHIILCTSTPSSYIDRLAWRYGFPGVCAPWGEQYNGDTGILLIIWRTGSL